MSSGMEQTFEIDTTVGAVQQVVKGTKTPYEVVLAGGADKITGQAVEADAFIDWKKTVGPQAIGLQNQQASARVKIKYVPRQDGDGFWENKEVLAIAPLGMLPPAGQPVAGGTPAVAVPPQPMVPQAVMPAQATAQQPGPVAQMPAVQPQTAPPPQTGVSELIGRQALSEAQRTRQGIVKNAVEYVAAQAAAGMFDGSTDCDAALKARIEDLARYTMTGSFDGNPEPDVTPEQIAAQVEGVEVGTDNITPGVPFDTTQGGEEGS